MRRLLNTSSCFLLLTGLLVSSVPTFGQTPPAAAAQTESNTASFPKANRILFLGDSITHAGGYIAYIEAAAIEQIPNRNIEFLNLGLSSETVSGLSEPGHAGGKFPRPDLHERLARVLKQTKPELVVACYGMNDGIYHPLSDERFAKFKDGMNRLHAAVVEAGADIIHITPPVFDAVPIAAKVLPAGRDTYPQPYAGYDEVLTEYAKWLVSRRADGWKVIDLHSAMKAIIDKKRESDPKFTYANDGVHPNEDGQKEIARPLAHYWGLKLLDEQAEPENATEGSRYSTRVQVEQSLKLIREKQNTLKLAWLTATKHLRPGVPEGMPLEDAEAKAKSLDTVIRASITRK